MNSSEQRSAFRIPMPDGQKRAKLRAGGRSFDVQLIDASASGVAVACPLTVSLDIDDCCELHTASGGSLIRIVRKEVFSDGVLLGATRVRDLPEGSSGLLNGGLRNQARELLTLPRAVWGNRAMSRLVMMAVLLALSLGGFQVAEQWSWWGAASQVEATQTTTAPQFPEPLILYPATQAVETTHPAEPAPLSESDQRAQRIFAQHKQLLHPDVSKRLRLTPAQESEIQRALEAAQAAAHPSEPDFWEAIRRCELQILGVLSPIQVKAWRQMNST
jgi:hypothetical protein